MAIATLAELDFGSKTMKYMASFHSTPMGKTTILGELTGNKPEEQVHNTYCPTGEAHSTVQYQLQYYYSCLPQYKWQNGICTMLRQMLAIASPLLSTS